MERVMLNKVAWMVEHTDWEILIVTTDQKGRPPFYPIPDRVRTMDLDINYSDDNHLSTFGKIKGYLNKRKQHKQKLTELLMKEKADVVVSLFPSESSFLPDIKDGSKKVLELHFNKFFRLQYGRTGLYGQINKWRTRQDEKLVRRFDKFVVLTEEDKGYWGETGNIIVIPNAAKIDETAEPTKRPIDYENETLRYDKFEKETKKRVIAVGRLDYQKGFDRLIKAWGLVQQDHDLKDWQLDIFGQGEWKEMLENLIKEQGLEKSAHINAPTKEIVHEYKNSSFLVMSSHYEGFPMVMIEAMAAGLPVVSFDFKCGPKDIIEQGVNGIYVHEGDIEALANAMAKVMKDEVLREKMSKSACQVTERYSEEKVMSQWMKLFNELCAQ